MMDRESALAGRREICAKAKKQGPGLPMQTRASYSKTDYP